MAIALQTGPRTNPRKEQVLEMMSMNQVYVFTYEHKTDFICREYIYSGFDQWLQFIEVYVSSYLTA